MTFLLRISDVVWFLYKYAQYIHLAHQCLLAVHRQGIKLKQEAMGSPPLYFPILFYLRSSKHRTKMIELQFYHFFKKIADKAMKKQEASIV